MKPRKMTEERVGLIVQCLEIGMPIKQMCKYAGIHHDTYYQWMKAGKAAEEGTGLAAFYNAVETAKASVYFDALSCIKKAAKSGKWQAAAWLLERRLPDEFGRVWRVEEEARGHAGEEASASPERALEAVLEELSPQAQGELLKALEKHYSSRREASGRAGVH